MRRDVNESIHLSNQSFVDLGVPADLSDVLAGFGITTPTPIQAATLNDSLSGRDVLGRGRTGSGKTYAFLLPLVARLVASRSRRSGSTSKAPRALILAPTRELVGQIEAALKPLAEVAGLTSVTVFGGVGHQPQIRALRNGVDVVVACPGRLEDLISQGACRLSQIEVTVLDEADHMADLGFLPAVTRLLAQTPETGQRMLFSATLDGQVAKLVQRFLHQPCRHEADSALSPVGAMDHHVLHVERDGRVDVLADLTSAPGRTVVFTRTKHGAKALARQLNARGVPTVELHGNLAQNARTRNMAAFHSGEVDTLVATDIAARGIHVDDVALVVHADPPVEHKAYVHRSGRTARAGSSGTVVTLMTESQTNDVRALTRAAGVKPTVTRVRSTADPILRQLAPGERRLVPVTASVVAAGSPSAERGAGQGRGRRGGGGPRRSQTGPESSGAGNRRGGRTRPSAAAAPSGGSRSAAAPGSHTAASFSRRTRSR